MPSRGKSFIQSPIFVVLVVGGILILGSISYISVNKYQNYKFEQAEKGRLAREEINKQAVNIEELKREVDILKNRKTEVITKVVPQQQSSFDLQNIIKTWHPMIVYIECLFKYSDGTNLIQSGSGVLKNSMGSISAVTNRHVLINKNGQAPSQCRVVVPFDKTYINTGVSVRKDIDFGSVDIINPDEYIKNLPMLQQSGIYSCNIDGSIPEIGTQIVILGYPGIGSETDITATQGIISGYDDDYYITDAKIEHGNSGGAAISVNGNCYLGIPTGVVSGTLESLGRILKWQSL